MTRFTSTFDPARNWYAITPGPDALEPRPKALWANSAGTITAVGDDDNDEDFVVPGPGPVAISPVKVTAWTGGAGLIAVVD